MGNHLCRKITDLTVVNMVVKWLLSLIKLYFFSILNRTKNRRRQNNIWNWSLINRILLLSYTKLFSSIDIKKNCEQNSTNHKTLNLKYVITYFFYFFISFCVCINVLLKLLKYKCMFQTMFSNHQQQKNDFYYLFSLLSFSFSFFSIKKQKKKKKKKKSLNRDIHLHC